MTRRGVPRAAVPDQDLDPRADTMTLAQARLLIRTHLAALQRTDPPAARDLEAALAAVITNAMVSQ